MGGISLPHVCARKPTWGVKMVADVALVTFVVAPLAIVVWAWKRT